MLISAGGLMTHLNVTHPEAAQQPQEQK